MNELRALISMENCLIAFPWIVNCLSLLGAYSLSNNKVKLGRYIGVCSSIGWACYGFLIGEYSFIFANVIFFYIYASAVYKFNQKRDEYKATFEEQEAEIKKQRKENQFEINKLHKELDKKKLAIQRDFEAKQKALFKIKIRARKQLEALEQVINFDGYIVDDDSTLSDEVNADNGSTNQLLIEDKSS